jgi:hypothetical protein
MKVSNVSRQTQPQDAHLKNLSDRTSLAAFAIRGVIPAAANVTR